MKWKANQIESKQTAKNLLEKRALLEMSHCKLGLVGIHTETFAAKFKQIFEVSLSEDCLEEGQERPEDEHVEVKWSVVWDMVPNGEIMVQ